MATQFNVRIPESTEKQLEYLLKKTGMTQTQLVIQAIDRLFLAYQEDLMKALIEEVKSWDEDWKLDEK